MQADIEDRHRAEEEHVELTAALEADEPEFLALARRYRGSGMTREEAALRAYRETDEGRRIRAAHKRKAEVLAKARAKDGEGK